MHSFSPAIGLDKMHHISEEFRLVNWIMYDLFMS